MKKFSNALIIGSSGGIGSALAAALQSQGATVTGLHRRSLPPVDLTSEATIETAADELAGSEPFDLILIATGALALSDAGPEKSLRQLDPTHLAEIMALNAIGPALAVKHFHRLLPREGRSVIAALSARVGSIGDNRLGGWYGYRASKAALNQFMHTAAIEIARTRKDAIVLALHPGTVETRLSARFTQTRDSFRPDEAASKLLHVTAAATPEMSGRFYDHAGAPVQW